MPTRPSARRGTSSRRPKTSSAPCRATSAKTSCRSSRPSPSAGTGRGASAPLDDAITAATAADNRVAAADARQRGIRPALRRPRAARPPSRRIATISAMTSTAPPATPTSPPIDLTRPKPPLPTPSPTAMPRWSGSAGRRVYHPFFAWGPTPVNHGFGFVVHPGCWYDYGYCQPDCHLHHITTITTTSTTTTTGTVVNIRRLSRITPVEMPWSWPAGHRGRRSGSSGRQPPARPATSRGRERRAAGGGPAG